MHWFASRLNRIALAKNEPRATKRFAYALVPLLLSGLLQSVSLEAQTVRIDAAPSHLANTFSPLQALGSTVDRIPSNTTDIFFRPDQIQQILEAGWGPVSYRQNTELFVQAWHWNPDGAWSDPSGKGYFTGEPDGTWGSASIDALKRFQHDQNLVEDGKIGSLSLIALGLGPKREAAPVETEQKTP